MGLVMISFSTPRKDWWLAASRSCSLEAIATYERTFLVIGCALFGGTGFAQGIIKTVAGNDWIFPNQVPASTAPIGAISGLAIDTAGTIYASDPENHIVVKIDPVSGVLTIVAGNGSAGF